MDFPYVNAKANFASVYRVYRRTRFTVPVAFAKALTFLLILALVKRSDICISVSNYTASFLLKNGVSSQKIRVSGNGVDLEIIDRFKSPRKLYEGIFVGRIARDKGVFDLVKIWGQIVSTRPESRLMIVGSGPDSLKLRELAEGSGVSSKIILRGSCEDSELYTLMRTSRTFLFPSMFEGWGLAVGEALACGLSVVCYDIPALREIFGACRSVYLIPIGDTQKFAETTEKILEREDLGELEKISREYVGRFNWEKVAMEDLQIIRTLVHQHT
jgi:glycosyltransferase involved in cell wall biosynthesis